MPERGELPEAGRGEQDSAGPHPGGTRRRVAVLDAGHGPVGQVPGDEPDGRRPGPARAAGPAADGQHDRRRRRQHPMAAIITTQVSRHSPSAIAAPPRMPPVAWPVRIPARMPGSGHRQVASEARADSPTRAASRPRSLRCGWLPAPAAAGVLPVMGLRPGPVEGEVLAGPARPLPAEPKSVGLVGDRRSLGGDPAGADLGSRRVVDLDPLAGQPGRPGKRLAPRLYSPRDPCGPPAKVAVDLELDGGRTRRPTCPRPVRRTGLATRRPGR